MNCDSILFYQILSNYGNRLVPCGTIITSIICIIVFARINDSSRNDNRKSQMFKYFLMKSVYDLTANIYVLFEILNYIHDYSHTYLWGLWFIWLYNYLFYLSVSLSNCMEVAATFDCYSMISNKFKFLLNKKSFYVFLIVTGIVNALLNVHYLFIYEIVRGADLSLNKTGYSYVFTNYTTKSYFNSIQYTILIWRDVITLVLLLTLNCLILFALRNISKRKKILRKNNTALNIANEMRNAELNKVKFILIISFSFIILRMPDSIYQIPFHDDNTFWECYYKPMYIILYDLSFLIQIFNYYFFNKKFKNYFNSTLIHCSSHLNGNRN
jgi:hypothetical protein